MSAELPGAPENAKAAFSDEELVRLLYTAMPKLFRDEFRKSGRRLNTETFESLQDYFSMLEDVYPSKPTAETRNNKGHNISNNGNNGNALNNNTGSRNNNRSNNNNRNHGRSVCLQQALRRQSRSILWFIQQ